MIASKIPLLTGLFLFQCTLFPMNPLTPTSQDAANPTLESEGFEFMTQPPATKSLDSQSSTQSQSQLDLPIIPHTPDQWSTLPPQSSAFPAESTLMALFKAQEMHANNLHMQQALTKQSCIQLVKSLNDLKITNQEFLDRAEETLNPKITAQLREKQRASSEKIDKILQQIGSFPSH